LYIATFYTHSITETDHILSADSLIGLFPPGHPIFNHFKLEPISLYRTIPNEYTTIQLNHANFEIKHIQTLCNMVLDISFSKEKILNNDGIIVMFY